MILKLKTRDKSDWHGINRYTLSLYLECKSAEDRDRVWSAIEDALSGKEKTKERSIGLKKEEG